MQWFEPMTTLPLAPATFASILDAQTLPVRDAFAYLWSRPTRHAWSRRFSTSPSWPTGQGRHGQGAGGPGNGKSPVTTLASQQSNLTFATITGTYGLAVGAPRTCKSTKLLPQSKTRMQKALTLRLLL
jgi:hypothetical protein